MYLHVSATVFIVWLAASFGTGIWAGRRSNKMAAVAKAKAKKS